MINKILTWFLESNNHISRFQSGFRSDHSTTDNLVRLETFIRDAFIKKEHVVAVFFIWKKLMISHGDTAFQKVSTNYSPAAIIRNAKI